MYLSSSLKEKEKRGFLQGEFTIAIIFHTQIVSEILVSFKYFFRYKKHKMFPLQQKTYPAMRLWTAFIHDRMTSYIIDYKAKKCLVGAKFLSTLRKDMALGRCHKRTFWLHLWAPGRNVHSLRRVRFDQKPGMLKPDRSRRIQLHSAQGSLQRFPTRRATLSAIAGL